MNMALCVIVLALNLWRIRREIKSSQRRIKTNLDGILKIHDYQKYFQDNIVTIRDERYVILSNKNIVNISQVSYMTNPLVVLLYLLNLCLLLT